MCEFPKNGVLIDEFAKRIEGLSIRSDGLAQPTFGD